MFKVEGKLLSRIIAAGTCSLCAHIAFAATPVIPATPPAQAGFQTVQQGGSVQQIDAVAVQATSSPLDQEDGAIADVQADARQIECVAKVIRHEAANQPIDGQYAVAQVIRTRMNDGRFPTTACGVVSQRGQFFDVDAYDPPRDDARWATAMRIAAATLNGEGAERADGALFFHSAGVGMPGRVRVTKIAGHTFYR